VFKKQKKKKNEHTAPI